jgi:hypothetical protein
MLGLLDWGTVLFSFVAAAFWLLSAAGELPPMVAYFDRTPATDPLYRKLKFSARMNTVAAACSGVAALLLGIKVFLGPPT